MVKKHLKRQQAPVTWKISRKGTKYVSRPSPGKRFKLSMPISMIFKNLLKYCKTTKEVKSILQNKEIIVDEKRRKNHRYPVGLMDVLSIPISDENYRLLLDKKGKLNLIKIDKKNTNIKPCKIIGKTKLKGGITQINFLDSRNLRVEEDKNYSVGDTLVLNIENQKVINHFKLEKGNYILFIGGKNIGSHGKIKKIKGNMIEVENKEGNKIISDIKFAYVIGDKNPIIKLFD